MCNVIVTKHLHLALCTLPQNMPCTVLLSQRNRLTRELREFNFEIGFTFHFRKKRTENAVQQDYPPINHPSLVESSFKKEVMASNVTGIRLISILFKYTTCFEKDFPSNNKTNENSYYQHCILTQFLIHIIVQMSHSHALCTLSNLTFDPPSHYSD